MTKDLSTNEAWKKLFDKYKIVETVEEQGYIILQSKQIKEFKEPRLMAKWDSSESLPQVLKRNNINILAISRGSYILSDFNLYKEIPILPQKRNIKKMYVPKYETIDINNITSEANAINVMLIANILDDFLGVPEGETVATFNGRMGTGEFNFLINTKHGTTLPIEVKNAQCEIDGGYENFDNVIILEAKNVIYKDFNVRQLYYPYRLWANKVNKPIRLIYSIYSNKIYRLLEYEFTDINNYSSIRFIREKSYSLENTDITLKIIEKIRNDTKIKYNDYYKNSKVTFIQANDFDRIISLLENMYNNPMTKSEIAELMQFKERQSDYYVNAGIYLDLFEKNADGKRQLTELGNRVVKMNYVQRIYKLISLMFEHRIFAELFDYFMYTRQRPSKNVIENKMRELQVCSESLIYRRASTVRAWFNWILSVINK